MNLMLMHPGNSIHTAYGRKYKASKERIRQRGRERGRERGKHNDSQTAQQTNKEVQPSQDPSGRVEGSAVVPVEAYLSHGGIFAFLLGGPSRQTNSLRVRTIQGPSKLEGSKVPKGCRGSP